MSLSLLHIIDIILLKTFFTLVYLFLIGLVIYCVLWCIHKIYRLSRRNKYGPRELNH